MFITDNIDPYWFLISLCIGLFVVYTSTPLPEVIIKYPTPENADTLIFKDKTDNCYKFNTTEVNCPSLEKIYDIPITD